MYVYFHDGKIKVKPTLPRLLWKFNLKNANIFVLSGINSTFSIRIILIALKIAHCSQLSASQKIKAYHSTVQSIHKQNHKVAWFYIYFKCSVLFNMISRKCCNVMIIIQYRRWQDLTVKHVEKTLHMVYYDACNLRYIMWNLRYWESIEHGFEHIVSLASLLVLKNFVAFWHW